MAGIRVLVVEDSLTVRRRLCEILAADPELDVIGEAQDGKRAIDLCWQLRPDVVTLDMMLPVMSGLAVTEYIMAYCPAPILVVSASTNRGELFRTYDALAAGAVDVLEKPRGGEPDGQWEQRFIGAVKLISRIKVITHPRARIEALFSRPTSRCTNGVASSPGRFQVVAIGASTGGPAAIVEVVRSLRPGFPLPILVVLHINAPFGAAFAEWLDGQTPLRASYARDGESLAGVVGRIALAPPDRHLVVRGSRLNLTSDPERHSCRPSVDVLFESVARECGPSGLACLLTGMGRDGADGLLEMRRAGGLTIAQDETTSVVYGMPREAVALGAAGRILPLAEIGPALADAALPLREGQP